MARLILYTFFIIGMFYIFGCLINASFDLTLWDKSPRELLFSCCAFVCVIFWAFYAAITVTNKNSNKKKES